MVSLCGLSDQMKKVREKCENGLLTPPGEHKAAFLFEMAACVDMVAFYGRCLGLQVKMKLNG